MADTTVKVYPAPVYPACVVMVKSPLGGLGLVNLGGTIAADPFQAGGKLVPDNIVCPKAKADAVAAELAKVSGLSLVAHVDPAGAFTFVNANMPGTVALSVDVDVYTLWDTNTNQKAPIGGNMQQYITAEEKMGVGYPHHYTFEPTPNSPDKNPQFQLIFD